MMRQALIIMMLCVCSAMSAQMNGQGPNRGNRPQAAQERFNPEQFVKELKEFITQEAQLTPAEANALFPMIFEMHGKTQYLQRKQRELMMKGSKLQDSAADEEYEKIIDEVTKLEVASKHIEQNYYKKFHNVVSWKKVFKVRRAIDRFHLHALRKFQPMQFPKHQ